MPYLDKTLICKDCGQQFIWKSGEQEFFDVKGFPPPTRCSECRKKRKEGRDQSGPQVSQSTTKHEIVCSKCGKIGQVPFTPRNPEGVLCAQCFEEQNKQK